jgi:type I restriction enzyme S subunit
LKRFSLEENDIVLAMDRPWVKSGLKIAKVSPKELPSLLIQRTACIRAPKDISSDFIFYSLQTDKYIKHLVSQQTGVGVPHISGKQILSYKISIPNFKEQQRIVSRLDSLSAHIRELEEVTQKTIAECDALKQALLRKVFE